MPILFVVVQVEEKFPELQLVCIPSIAMILRDVMLVESIQIPTGLLYDVTL